MQKTALRHFLTGSDGDSAPSHPFSHHEILELIAPFTRSGRHVDLEASDRLQRRLQFKPIDHADDEPTSAGMREILQLDNFRPDSYRLTRTLSLPCGLKATLQTEGSDPGTLLARIAAMQPQRQFRNVAGVIVARDYRLEPAAPARPNAVTEIRAVLTRCEARIEDIKLVLNAATVKGYPAEFELADKDGDDVELPEDLLAVIGWGWGPLRRNGKGWRSNLRVPGTEPARSRQTEIKMEKAVTHLAHTLAAPPQLFHERLLHARWGVVFRRGIPLLIFGGLIAGAGALTFVDIPPSSFMNLVMMGTPPLLLFGAFGVSDRPPLEIPPLPRRSKATAWRKEAPSTRSNEPVTTAATEEISSSTEAPEIALPEQRYETPDISSPELKEV
jgi:hypothetical protein